MMGRIVWIGGWGVPPEWLAAEARREMPQWEHSVFPPAPDVFENARWNSGDWVGGYSFGAFLLLKANQQKPIANRGVLLAPFFSYPFEHDKGGKIRRTQIRFLARWLKSDPEAALSDFYARAGLPVFEMQSRLPYSLEDLQWGLSVLESDEVAPRVPCHWRAICGAEDPLLDAERVRQLAPAVQVVEGAGHAPGPLLGAIENLPSNCDE